MVFVNVIIAERVNKVADTQFTYMGHHMHQQRIRTDVERHPKERVRGALVQLAMQNAPALDLKLKQRMTGRQVNVVSLPRVPTRNDQSSRVWVVDGSL